MSIQIRPRLLVSTVSVTIVAGALAWLAAVPAGAQRTIGRVPSGAALVDFRVLGSDGAPVTDLKPEEVTVSVDGRQRVIQALRFMNVAEGAASEPGAEAPPPPYGTNTLAEGQRNVLIMFNDVSIRAGQEPGVKAAISQFVSSLAPGDQVALMTTPRGNVRTEFSTDREAFEAALANVVGKAAPTATVEEFTCDTRDVLTELRTLFTSLNGQTAPTYVMFFSAGLAAPTTGGARIGEAGSACELRVDSYQDLATAAAAGRVQIYVLQPEGLTTSQPGNEGLENLAGVTSGSLNRVGSSGSGILQRIARETSAYYAAVIGLEDVPRDSQPHRLQVSVSRPGARSIAHSELILGRPAAAAEAETPSVRDMLRTEAPFRDLGVKVGGYSVRGQPGEEKLNVLAFLQPVESVTLKEVAAGLVNEEGKLVAQWTAQPAELEMPIVFGAIPADPGTYRMRMAAVDSTGRAGAADYTINVGLHDADSVKVSDAWTFSTATGSYMPALEYTGDDTAMVLFELYGQPGADFFAQAELAKTADGPMLQNPQLEAAPGGEGFFRIVGQFPLADLEPGDYVVRFTLGRDPQVKLFRTVRKVE